MSDDAPPPPPPAPEPGPPPNPTPVSSDPDAPAYGAGKVSAADDKTYCMLAQFFSFVIWPWKKDESPAVDAWGKEALNFFLTSLGAQVVLWILGFIPFVGCLTIPLSMVVGLGSLVLIVIATLKASEGKLYRYPVNLRVIK